MRTRNIFEALAVVAALAGGFLLATNAQQPAAPQWVPGGPDMMPQSMLMQFPCHDDEMECFKIPAPAIQKVAFSAPLNGDPKRGKDIAINIRWGNCIACHSLPDGQVGGDVGPDLSKHGLANVDLAQMYQRIWDVRAFSPDAHMPIYGTNKVLTDKDIRDVMAYIMTGK